MLPKAVKQKLKLEQQPILRNTEQATGLLLPPDPSAIKSEMIETNFAVGTEHLKIRVCSVLWYKHNIIIKNWFLACW